VKGCGGRYLQAVVGSDGVGASGLGENLGAGGGSSVAFISS